MKTEKTSLSSDSRKRVVPCGNKVVAFGGQAFFYPMRTELEAPGQSVGFEITNDNGEHYTAVDCPSRIAEIVKRRIGQGERVRQRGTRR